MIAEMSGWRKRRKGLRRLQWGRDRMIAEMTYSAGSAKRL